MICFASSDTHNIFLITSLTNVVISKICILIPLYISLFIIPSYTGYEELDMPVIDIGLPTGFTPQKDDFEIVRNYLYLTV